MKCLVLTFCFFVVLLAVSGELEFNVGFRKRTGTSASSTSKRESSSRIKRRSDDDDVVVPRILGGQPANENEFPYQALLSYDHQPFCAATIIHERWLLTARHCIEEEWLDIATVTIGTNRLDGVGGLIKEVELFVPNDQYVYKSANENNGLEFVMHDIGLVRLKDPIVWSSKVQPTRIPSPEYPNLGGKMGVIAGWGQTKKASSSDVLMSAKVRVLSQATCRRYWRFIRDLHLCTSTGAGKNFCLGDSGGGLIIDDRQYGIISAANDNCTGSTASLYTDVSAYTWWIERELQRWGDSVEIGY